MRACWLKWVGRDWSISADYIWLNYSGANIGTRIARNENNIPLEPLSGVNGHYRDVCTKVIREKPQGALGKDANEIVEALRRPMAKQLIARCFRNAPINMT